MLLTHLFKAEDGYVIVPQTQGGEIKKNECVL
jgi:hypothetical protein